MCLSFAVYLWLWFFCTNENLYAITGVDGVSLSAVRQRIRSAVPHLNIVHTHKHTHSHRTDAEEQEEMELWALTRQNQQQKQRQQQQRQADDTLRFSLEC